MPLIQIGSIPHINALFLEAEEALFNMQTYLLKVEEDLCRTLKEDAIPSPDLVRAIAIGKISSVELSISLW
jgi:hypothetical protein